MTTAEPHLEDRDEQPYVGISTEASRSEWGQVNALVGELVGWLEKRDETLAGAPFYRFDEIGDDTEPFSLMVEIPTESQLSGDERVQAGTVPGGTYAVTIHEGHPDDPGQSHAKLQAWPGEQGHELARSVEGDSDVWEGRYEHYLTDPDEEPDPVEWSTEITYVVE